VEGPLLQAIDFDVFFLKEEHCCALATLQRTDLPRRSAKAEIDARTGIFLVYAQILKNLLYFDVESHEVKSAQHARYDEGMNDVPDPPSNARLVRFSQRGEPFPAETTLLEPPGLDVSENPFRDLRTLSVLAGGEDSHRVCLLKVLPSPPCILE
jgi:hypothetical protein